MQTTEQLQNHSDLTQLPEDVQEIMTAITEQVAHGLGEAALARAALDIVASEAKQGPELSAEALSLFQFTAKVDGFKLRNIRKNVPVFKDMHRSDIYSAMSATEEYLYQNGITAQFVGEGKHRLRYSLETYYVSDRH